MKIARVRWQGWEAVRCEAGDCELIVGVSAGPRILSLRHGGGPNLLYRDTTDFRVGEWRLYGGHRFTIAPETAASYVPDNAPCVVETREPGLRVTALHGPDGTRRILGVAAAELGEGFDLWHVLENQGPQPWRGALWAITCVPPHPGRLVAPFPHPRLRLWPGSQNGPWQLGPGHLAMVPDGTRGKAGWHSDAGWLAWLRPDVTFVIHSPDAPPPHQCVDEGCNLEVFTCPDFVELETLAGATTVQPGGRSVHFQRWRLLAPSAGPVDWQTLGAHAGCGTSPAVA